MTNGATVVSFLNENSANSAIRAVYFGVNTNSDTRDRIIATLQEQRYSHDSRFAEMDTRETAGSAGEPENGTANKFRA